MGLTITELLEAKNLKCLGDYSLDEIKHLAVSELRRLTRATNHPKWKGSFVASADKELLVSALIGSITGAEAVTAYISGQLDTDDTPDTTPDPEPGDHPATPAPVGGMKGLRDLLTAIGRHDLLNSVNDRIGEVTDRFHGILAVASTEKQRADARARRAVKVGKEYRRKAKAGGSVKVEMPKLSGTGNAVNILGLDAPIIDSASDIPEVDEKYLFDAWRGHVKAGVHELETGGDDLLRMVLADQRVMLVGPPSVGKTTILEQFAAHMKWACFRVNMRDGFDFSEFVGYMEASGGSTEFRYGILPNCMKIGGLLILDEFEHAPPSVNSMLHSVLEPGGVLVNTANGGEVVKPAPTFRIVGTGNTDGHGDRSGLHGAAHMQDAAFLSRWGAMIRVEYPKAGHEITIIRNRSGVDFDTAEKIVKIANHTRESGEFTHPIDLRGTQAWASMTQVMGCPFKGFMLAVVAKQPVDAREASGSGSLTELYQMHFGTGAESDAVGDTPHGT